MARSNGRKGPRRAAAILLVYGAVVSAFLATIDKAHAASPQDQFWQYGRYLTFSLLTDRSRSSTTGSEIQLRNVG